MTLSFAFLPAGAWAGIVAAGACMAVLPFLKRDRTWSRTLVISACLILLARYLVWRWTSTLPPVGLTINYVAGLVFIVMETLALASSAASLVFLTRIRDRKGDVETNLPWLLEQARPPLVDVFICTYNEEEAILERTIVGSLAIEYPNFRVWILDDGRRPWLRELCDRLGCGYITRGDNSHAKAGNINNGLDHVAALATPPDFIAILDADFVPLPDFLTRSLTLFRDERVGVVQTPQHFANPDPMQSNLALAQVWPDEQRYFFDVLMASKDAWGAAFCCGTSSVIRFGSLRRIGGFPTDSVTEDYLLSLRLRQIGFETVYLNERLSLGLAPEGLREYIVQRSRWCLGFVQICLGVSGPLRFGNGLRWADRVILGETFLYWSAGHAYRLLGLIVPVAYTLFGIETVQAPAGDALLYFTPYFAVQILGVGWLSEARCLPILGDLSALLAANEILKSVYRGITKPLGQKFQVTAKGRDRSKRFVQTPVLLGFLTLLCLTLLGIWTKFLMDPARGLQDASMLALFWSWYNIVVLILACFVCIEQPRFRRSERFAAKGSVRVLAPGLDSEYRVQDISTGGLSLKGQNSLHVDDRVVIEIEGVQVNGSVVRASEIGFAVAANDDFDTRAAMIRLVYSGHFDIGVSRIQPRKVAMRLIERVMR